MIIVYGRYRWAPARIGFRNSYCLSCEAPCRSTQVRTWDCGHLYWLPLVPLGPRKRWLCDTCGKQPDQRVRTSMAAKVAGLVILTIGAVGLWVDKIPPGEEGFYWTCRFLLPAIVIGCIAYMARDKPPGGTYADKLRAVPPAQDTSCRFCTTALASSPAWHCPSCHAQRV